MGAKSSKIRIYKRIGISLTVTTSDEGQKLARTALRRFPTSHPCAML
jgi:hypothetical protein